MKKQSTLIAIALFAVAGTLVPFYARANSFSYTIWPDQNACRTAPYGFTWSWAGGSVGCPSGQTCVASSPTAGDSLPAIPKCMPNEAATLTNYTDSTECATACGRVCTSNPNNYIKTYYCAAPPPATTGVGLGGDCTYSACISGLTCTYQNSLGYSTCVNSAQTSTQIKAPPVTTTQIKGPPVTKTTEPIVKLINPLNSGDCTPNGDCLMDFLTRILEFIVRIGAIIVILMLVYVGFLFVTARGEPGKITTARQALLWTVVGALILLGAEVIAKGIEATVKALSTGG